MHTYINNKVLITTSDWFYAPDGKYYKSVWGTLKGVHEAGKSLGFIPNRSHANWYIEIGNMTLMGCRVMYVIKCDSPFFGRVKDWNQEKGEYFEYERPSVIYNADVADINAGDIKETLKVCHNALQT